MAGKKNTKGAPRYNMPYAIFFFSVLMIYDLNYHGEWYGKKNLIACKRGGSGAGLGGSNSSNTDDDDVEPDSYVEEGKSGKPIYETADGKTVEDDEVLEDTDKSKSALDTT
ncbi:hypothetical protein L1987_06114 [Smallanthus sonchifolius]|uniref:Uncharacterized protein n=1 Tax=Smallanthus sonchifolius TaxID=185202 RepID=A0ACB9JXB2_9ASTR|nr:hypothetical protein L1987_06114 [Smallanthus sonchifolius]